MFAIAREIRGRLFPFELSTPGRLLRWAHLESLSRPSSELSLLRRRRRSGRELRDGPQRLPDRSPALLNLLVVIDALRRGRWGGSMARPLAPDGDSLRSSCRWSSRCLRKTETAISCVSAEYVGGFLASRSVFGWLDVSVPTVMRSTISWSIVTARRRPSRSPSEGAQRV